MNTIQKLLLLLLSVPCAYGMQSSIKPEDIQLIANHVADEFDRREQEKATADCGDNLGSMVLGGILVGEGCTLGLSMLFDTLNYTPPGHVNFLDQRYRNVAIGAVAGLALWVYRNPMAVHVALERVKNGACAISCQCGKGAATFIANQLNKERDWRMLDEQLAANNTL